MGGVEGVRWPLLVVALVGFTGGAWPLLWLFSRMGRAISRHPQAPVSMSRYIMALATGVTLLSLGAASLALLVALEAWRGFTNKTRVAEVQCIEVAPQKLKVYFVPVDPDGTRGATETYDIDGDAFQVGGEVLRFKPFLTALGVQTVFKIDRVEGRWIKANDANAHKATAFDRAGGVGPGWLQLYRDGAHGPLAWLIDGAHGQAISQLPDRRAVYDLFVTPNGFIVDKRSL
jgi:hypothetical protein